MIYSYLRFVPVAEVLIRSQESTTVLSDVSAPMVNSVPGILFDSVAGTTTTGTWQPPVDSSRAVKYASYPPIIMRPCKLCFLIAATTLSTPKEAAVLRVVPILVPP